MADKRALVSFPVCKGPWSCFSSCKDGEFLLCALVWELDGRSGFHFWVCCSLAVWLKGFIYSGRESEALLLGVAWLFWWGMLRTRCCVFLSQKLNMNEPFWYSGLWLSPSVKWGKHCPFHRASRVLLNVKVSKDSTVTLVTVDTGVNVSSYLRSCSLFLYYFCLIFKGFIPHLPPLWIMTEPLRGLCKLSCPLAKVTSSRSVWSNLRKGRSCPGGCRKQGGHWMPGGNCCVYLSSTWWRKEIWGIVDQSAKHQFLEKSCNS